jgi:hypothetical protein
VGRTKPAAHFLGEEGTQCLCRQFGNGDQGPPSLNAPR